MEKKKSKNNIKYINEYNKSHYKQLKVQLQPEEYKVLEQELNRLKLTKIQFIRDAIQDLKNK